MSGRKTGLYFENYEKEWVLDGATVLYGSASELRATLEYDFLREKLYLQRVFDGGNHSSSCSLCFKIMANPYLW
ncbi:MAG: hypothetical protein ACLR7J_04760 [[Ruminococcus] torques]